MKRRCTHLARCACAPDSITIYSDAVPTLDPTYPPTTTYPPSYTQLRALLYEDVTNTDELRAKLLSGKLPEFCTSIECIIL